MKAWTLNSVKDISYGDVSKPVPSKGEVLVKVAACGICGSDIPRIYQNGAHKMPLIPGHEFSGRVEAVSDPCDNDLLGAKVGVFPLIPCMKCSSCQKKMYEMCKSYSYLGSRCDGGFADYVSVPKWNLIKLPENVSFEAAAMLEPMAVSVHAMRKADIKESDRVLVWGAGTIGLLLTMFLKDAGVERLILVGNHDYQRDYATLVGISRENFINVSDRDPIEMINKATDGEGVDVFFECVGKSEILKDAINVTSMGASIVTVGNPYGDVSLARDDYWNILRHQLKIFGTWNSSFLGEEDPDSLNDSWHYVLKRLEEGAIHPERLISHRLDKSELAKGLEIMRDKSQPYIKVMTTWEK
ncbi:MAG: galactitol-1-phosphate 5-dehydrogenase [Lachnospiraceae bacterium]|nr:galactitol-1-phosphate 5-dehydrogenase [Lachnospiraceae bacterium]